MIVTKHFWPLCLVPLLVVLWPLVGPYALLLLGFVWWKCFVR